MDSQYIVLSELLSDQAAFITSPKTSLANYWGALPPLPPVSTGLSNCNRILFNIKAYFKSQLFLLLMRAENDDPKTDFIYV